MKSVTLMMVSTMPTDTLDSNRQCEGRPAIFSESFCSGVERRLSKFRESYQNFIRIPFGVGKLLELSSSRTLPLRAIGSGEDKALESRSPFLVLRCDSSFAKPGKSRHCVPLPFFPAHSHSLSFASFLPVVSSPSRRHSSEISLVDIFAAGSAGIVHVTSGRAADVRSLGVGDCLSHANPLISTGDALKAVEFKRTNPDETMDDGT